LFSIFQIDKFTPFTVSQTSCKLYGVQGSKHCRF